MTFPMDEASATLRKQPYGPLSEPAVAVLGGQVEAGGHWAYSDPRLEPVLTFPRA